MEQPQLLSTPLVPLAVGAQAQSQVAELEAGQGSEEAPAGAQGAVVGVVAARAEPAAVVVGMGVVVGVGVAAIAWMATAGRAAAVAQA